MPKVFQSADKNRYTYKCPGCGNFHTYYINVPNKLGARWQFNGDINSPVFDSTMRVAIRNSDGSVNCVCHSMLRYGRVTFLSDSDFCRNRTIELDDILYS